ncbi:MAG TPA: hypothetical protein VIV40_06750 [Kofleriaceae bacterium]
MKFGIAIGSGHGSPLHIAGPVARSPVQAAFASRAAALGTIHKKNASTARPMTATAPPASTTRGSRTTPRSEGPKIQAEAPIVEVAEVLDDELAVRIEVARPLLEGQEIAVAVVEDFENVQRRLGKFVEKVVQDEEVGGPRIDVFDHE